MGFYRGLWIPLVTISFVRACDPFLLRLHAPTAFLGAASFTIYTETKDYFRVHNYLNRNSVLDAALVGGVGGAMSGSLISFGSARASLHSCLETTPEPFSAFELVKVICVVIFITFRFILCR